MLTFDCCTFSFHPDFMAADPLILMQESGVHAFRLSGASRLLFFLFLLTVEASHESCWRHFISGGAVLA